MPTDSIGIGLAAVFMFEMFIGTPAWAAIYTRNIHAPDAAYFNTPDSGK